MKTLRQAPDVCCMTLWAGQSCSPFPLKDVSTGRQAVHSAGGWPSAPICSPCSPAENSVLTQKGFPKIPSAPVFPHRSCCPWKFRAKFLQPRGRARMGIHNHLKPLCPPQTLLSSLHFSAFHLLPTPTPSLCFPPPPVLPQWPSCFSSQVSDSPVADSKRQKWCWKWKELNRVQDGKHLPLWHCCSWIDKRPSSLGCWGWGCSC